MNPDVKAKWIAALRSGNYKQAKHRLRIEHTDGSASYCCLGVLCELYRQETGEGKWLDDLVNLPAQDAADNDESYIAHDIISNNTNALASPRFLDGAKDKDGEVVPIAVRKWAALPQGNPTYGGPNGNDSSLADRNDAGYSFEQIADLIDRYL